jgi:hypothetical protein
MDMKEIKFGTDGWRGIISEPRFVRFREDKEVSPEDLRLTQVPDWRRRLREFEKQKE